MKLSQSTVCFYDIEIGEVFAITRDRSYITNPGICSCTLLSSMLSSDFKCCCKYKYIKKVEIYCKTNNGEWKNSIFLADDWDRDWANDGYCGWDNGYPGKLFHMASHDYMWKINKRSQRYWFRKENDGIS